MTVDWGRVFDNYGLKVVTHTDKSKSAYVLNKVQLDAVLAAGIDAAETRPGDPFEITLFLEPGKSVEATFYFSERVGAGRPPEPRMGREFITSWLKEGDQVVIGNIGTQLYAARLSGDLATISIAGSVAERADKNTKERLIDQAKKVSGKPGTRLVSRKEFVRNPLVVMGAIARSSGVCEMPECAAELFVKDDGLPYLEVHHVMQLADGGEDALSNAAALCPKCHRELHHGQKRMQLRSVLARHIASLT